MNIMKPECKHIRTNFESYYYKEMALSDLEMVDGHLGICNSCSMEYKAYIKMISIIDDDRITRSDAYLFNNIQKQIGKAESKPIYIFEMKRLIVAASIVFMILFAGVTGFYIGDKFAGNYLTEETYESILGEAVAVNYSIEGIDDLLNYE